MRFYRVLEDANNRRYGNYSMVPYPSDLLDLAIGHEDPPEEFHVDIVGPVGDSMFPPAWSTRMIQILESCRATGYKTYPLKVYKAGKPVSGYKGVKILGRGGPFDEQRSGVDKHEGIYHGYSAIHMFEDQWDGSDVFTIPGLGMGVFVVERVAEALMAADLSVIQLVLNSKCKFGTKDIPSTPPPP